MNPPKLPCQVRLGLKDPRKVGRLTTLAQNEGETRPEFLTAIPCKIQFCRKLPTYDITSKHPAVRRHNQDQGKRH